MTSKPFTIEEIDHLRSVRRRKETVETLHDFARASMTAFPLHAMDLNVSEVDGTAYCEEGNGAATFVR